MANLQVKDALGSTKYISVSGAGTDEDPMVFNHALGSSEALVGRVGASDNVVTVTPTLDPTFPYLVGYVLFNSTAVADAVRTEAGYAVLDSVTVLDKDDQGKAFTLLFADEATQFANAPNLPPNPDDNEVATVIGWVPIETTDYVDVGGAKVATVRNLGLLLKAKSGTTIYIAAVNGTIVATYTTTSSLVFKLSFLRG